MAALKIVLVLAAAFEVTSAVCYGTLGCYDSAAPFDNAGSLVPSPPNEVGTKFLLYTQAKKNQGVALSYTDLAALKSSGFDATLPVKFIVHGFTESESAPWMNTMKNAFLDTLKCNVIITGWALGAAAPNYNLASANTRLVGKQMSQLIQLMVQGGASLLRVHITGHSLGAHIAGYAGAELGGKVSRISGLDPAGPNFEDTDPRVRLDSTDANFVDVIHSNAAPLTKGGAGISAPVGHADFYPNGGVSQPGCQPLVSSSVAALSRGDFQAVSSIASCSHSRAYFLYTESITSKTCTFKAYGCAGGYADFQAGKCSNCLVVGCSEMGYNSDKFSGRGKLYLTTGSAANYCSTNAIIG